MSSPGHGTLDTSILEIEEELLGLECNSDVAENRFQHIDASFAVIDLLNQSVQDDFDTNQSLQNGAERDDRDAERQLKVDERAKEDLRKETEELCTSFELLQSTANSVTAVDKNDVEATLLKLDARLDNLGKENTSLMDATEAAKQRLGSLNAQLMTKRKANGDLRSQLDEKNEKRARLHIKQQQRSANAQMLREQLQSAERADADLKNRKLAATNFTATLNSNEAQSVAAVAAHEAQLHVMRDELTVVREKTSSVNEEVGEMQMSLESARSSLQQQKALIEEVADKLRTQALNADDTSSGADALERLKETRKQKEEELGKIVAEVPVQRQVLEELNAKKNNQKEADWTLRALEEDLAAAARQKEQMELEENLRAERERLEKERQKLDEERAEWAQREEQLNKELEEKQKAAAAEEHRAAEERRRLSEEQQRWEESQRQQKQAKTSREEERLKDNSPGPSKRSGDKKPASKRTSAQMDSSLDEDVGSSRSSDEDFSLGKTSRQSRPVFKKPAQTKPAAKRGRPPLTKKIDSVGLNQKRIESEGKAFEDVALWLTNAILCSIVESLGLTGLRMTPAFAGQLLDIREMFNAKFVSFYDMDLSLVSAPLLHSLLELMEKCVFKISLGNAQPPRGEHYKISADTILDFCFGHEGRKSVSRGLELGHVEFPPEFDDAIFERHKQSALKSHLYLKIHDIRLEQQYSVDSTYPGASSMPL